MPKPASRSAQRMKRTIHREFVKMESNQRIEQIFSTMYRYHKLWIIPTILGLLISAVYVVFLKSPSWTARQSLIIRDDLLGEAFKPGQFNSMESMKSAQETILEVARKPLVIKNALTQLGPSKSGWFSKPGEDWISEERIEDVQGSISFSAPNGAEFGKTEVVILSTKGSTRERAYQFNQLLLGEIDKKLGEVRTLRLQSMESELMQAKTAAVESLRQSVQELKTLEKRFGADISTMNGLNSSESGDGGVRRVIAELGKERRLVEAELIAARNTLEILLAADDQPEKMLATSSEFLKTQPTLEALKRSYVSLQETKSRNEGQYTSEHPSVKGSINAIRAMREQIYSELATIQDQVQSRIHVLERRIDELDEDIDAEQKRLILLGTLRVDHLAKTTDVKQYTELLNQAQRELAEIQALRKAAPSVEWLTRVDEPQVSTRPDGMGKKATILGGTICGFMFGLGLVMLLAPPQGPDGSRGGSSDVEGENSSQEPTLDEMVGPTAASAIQAASAKTAATVNRGIELAKHALGKKGSSEFWFATTVDQDAEPVKSAASESLAGSTPSKKTVPMASPIKTEGGSPTEPDPPVSVSIPHLVKRPDDKKSTPESKAIESKSTQLPQAKKVETPKKATEPHSRVSEPRAPQPVSRSSDPVGKQPAKSPLEPSKQDITKQVPQSPMANTPLPNEVSRPKPNDPVKIDTENTNRTSASRKPDAKAGAVQNVTAKIQSAPMESKKLESVLESLSAGEKRPTSNKETPSAQTSESESVRSAKKILAEIQAKSEARKQKTKTPGESAAVIKPRPQTASSQVPTPESSAGSKAENPDRAESKPARIRVRKSKQRPIDLAKSMEDVSKKDESSVSRDITPTVPTDSIDQFMASMAPSLQESDPNESENARTSAEETLQLGSECFSQQAISEGSSTAGKPTGENPFLKNRPKPNVNVAQPQPQKTETQERPTSGPETKAEKRPAKPSEETVSESRPESQTMPIPDQIKQISDSIAKYTDNRRTKTNDRETDQ